MHPTGTRLGTGPGIGQEKGLNDQATQNDPVDLEMESLDLLSRASPRVIVPRNPTTPTRNPFVFRALKRTAEV